MTGPPSPDPPPLPPLPPDPIFHGPSASSSGLSPSSSPSSPMDLFPEVSVSGSAVPTSNQANLPQLTCGPSQPLKGPLIFGSLSTSASLQAAPSVDSARANADRSFSAKGLSVVPSQSATPAGPAPPGDPINEGRAPTTSTPSTGGYNWASTLKSASKFPAPTASVTTSPEGKPRVKISNGVFERGAKIHSDYIVGIFYGKAPSYGKIWAVLNYLWGKDRRVTIHHLAKNAYIFNIPSPSLRKRILQHELWRVGDSPFFVTEWKAEFSLNPPALDKAPVWVKIQGIPFDLITHEGLSSVCSPLGRVVDAKPFTSISSAEVKVIADLTKPLPAEIELECDDGNLLLLEITYPWLPPLCPFCNEIGHKAALCPISIAKENHDAKGKGVAVDTDIEKDWQTPSRKNKRNKSKKKQGVSEANSKLDVPSSSKQASPDKASASLAPSPVVSSNKFQPLQSDAPKEVSKGGSSLPSTLVAPEAGSSTVIGASSTDKSLVLGFSPDPPSVSGNSIPQTSNQPPSSALVVCSGSGPSTMVSFGPSPKSSAERKKKKRKYSSPVPQGTSGFLPIEWRENHTPSN
ncbi:Uncharacterized protein Rs2_24090 [Raphanus sativus]|nr:Uncharacterized protein Rs2_24090 [Raphanus sativus]